MATSLSSTVTDSEGGCLPERILVAWHPDASDEAIDAAAWLARSTNVRVRAVCTLLRLWPSSSLGKLGGKYDEWLNKQTKHYVAKVKSAFADAGIPESRWDKNVGVVLDGPSESSLLTKAAQDFKADMIILGSQAAAPKGRFLSGTTTDALLHSSPTPLILTPRSVKLSKRGVTRVNAAFLTAEEERSKTSLHYSAALATHLHVPLRLVAFSPTGIVDSSASVRDLPSKLSDKWYEHALAKLDRARDLVMESLPDLTVEAEIGSGVGWRGAVDALKWKKGDLICLGSTEAGPLKRVFVGSTAAQFIQNVSAPVVIHPAQAQ